MSIEGNLTLQRGEFTLDVELDIPDRGITGIFGPSGCGKTTLLRAIAGLEQALGNQLKIGDSIWQNQTQFVPTHERAVGYVFQEASLFEYLTVKRNLEYGLKRVPERRRRVSLETAIDLLGIGHLLKRLPHQISGGERQRVAIARALAVSPDILLMDEPLSALDLRRKHEFMPYLESLHDELDVPVLYVSHSSGELARLADHLVLMDQGRIAASGAIDEMFTRMDLPLAHGDKAAALIRGRIASHDEAFNLTYVDFPGGRFSIPRKQFQVGHEVRLRVVARDVSITLNRQTDTSILNIFPARVEALIPEGDAQFMVRLSAQGVTLLARITRKSAQVLQLKSGKPVYAQVKTVALLS